MEKVSEKIVCNLIGLNMERMYRVQNARQLLPDDKRRKLLMVLEAQSEGFIMELEYVLRMYGGSVEDSASQTLYNIDFKSEGNTSVQAVFLFLLQHEQKDIATYESLLAEGSGLDNSLFEKIRAQKAELQESELKLKEVIAT